MRLQYHRGRERRGAAWGYAHIQVLDGGIDAWAERVEPAMPRYA